MYVTLNPDKVVAIQKVQTQVNVGDVHCSPKSASHKSPG